MNQRALVVIAVLTNPLVWVVVALAAAYMVIHAMLVYVRAELSLPERVLPWPTLKPDDKSPPRPTPAEEAILKLGDKWDRSSTSPELSQLPTLKPSQEPDRSSKPAGLSRQNLRRVDSLTGVFAPPSEGAIVKPKSESDRSSTANEVSKLSTLKRGDKWDRSSTTVSHPILKPGQEWTPSGTPEVTLVATPADPVVVTPVTLTKAKKPRKARKTAGKTLVDLVAAPEPPQKPKRTRQLTSKRGSA
jgi:hypothetical protein